MRRMFCRLCSVPVILLILMSVSFTASAKECSFSLSDAKGKKGREVQIDLFADTDGIASFVADFTFDSQNLCFVSASSSYADAELEANCLSEGKVVLVYLCKGGTKQSDSKPLLTLTFKALKEGGSAVDVNIRQVIDTEYRSIEALQCKSGMISINNSRGASNESTANLHESHNPDVHIKATYEEYQQIGDDGSDTTYIEGNPRKNQVIIFSVLAVLSLLSVVGFISFKAGLKLRKKDSETDHEK